MNNFQQLNNISHYKNFKMKPELKQTMTRKYTIA